MKLVNYITIISGGTPKTNNSDYWNGDIPWISIKDFNNMSRYILKTEKYITKLGLSKSSTNLLNVGDIIISARGTVGCISQLNSAMAFNQSCYGIRTNSHNLIQDYLYYWLKANNYKLLQNVHGAVFDTITKNTFDSLDINLPSLQYQQHIVDIIGSIDDKIENNNKIIEKFDKFMLSNFKSIYIKAQNEGKTTINLKNIINLTTGKKDANAGSEKGMYPFFTCSEKDSTINEYSFNQEAILIAGNGNMSVKYYNGKFDAYQRTYVIKPKKYFCYIYLFYKNFIKDISQGARGSVIKFLTKSMLEDIKIPIMLENEMELFEKQNKEVLNSIQSYKRENNKLEQLKQLYLKKFFG